MLPEPRSGSYDCAKAGAAITIATAVAARIFFISISYFGSTTPSDAGYVWCSIFLCNATKREHLVKMREQTRRVFLLLGRIGALLQAGANQPAGQRGGSVFATSTTCPSRNRFLRRHVA